jgi:hypothetical protein
MRRGECNARSSVNGSLLTTSLLLYHRLSKLRMEGRTLVRSRKEREERGGNALGLVVPTVKLEDTFFEAARGVVASGSLHSGIRQGEKRTLRDESKARLADPR